MRYSIWVFQFEYFCKHSAIVTCEGLWILPEATMRLLPDPCNQKIFMEVTVLISLILSLPDLNVSSLHSSSDVRTEPASCCADWWGFQRASSEALPETDEHFPYQVIFLISFIFLLRPPLDLWNSFHHIHRSSMKKDVLNLRSNENNLKQYSIKTYVIFPDCTWLCAT